MKRKIRQITEEIELPNPERIRMLGVKENHKYMEILETDTIKKAQTKKIRKNSEKEKNLLETKLYSRIMSMESSHLGQTINDEEQGLTSQRFIHRLYIKKTRERGIASI